MAKTLWNEKELVSRGMYSHTGTYYNQPYKSVEKLSQPISPRENMQRYMNGGDYEWIPDLTSDLVDITPFCNPDAVATGYKGGSDAFGVKWIPVENNPRLPSFVEPGFCLLEDAVDWEKLQWPDVDSWAWEEMGREYREVYRDDDRVFRGVLYAGFFERLISLMTFEGAAMALLTDPDAVKAFFDKLADMHNRIIDHYVDDFGCSAVLMHDDWGSQRAPLFSLDTAMDIIVPSLKKCVDHAHARGISFTLHSCGQMLDLLPAAKAAGVDIWQGQEDCLDLQEARAACGEEIIMEIYPVIDVSIQGEALEKHLRDYMGSLCCKGKCFIEFYDFDAERRFETRKLIYRIGREMA